MGDETRPSMRMIAGLAAVCLTLAVWISIGFVLPFRAASAGRSLLMLRIEGYEASDVFAMLEFLRSHPDAASLQHGLNFGPALAFALASACLLFLLLKWVRPGGIFFGRPIPPAGVAAMFCLPILYGLSSCGEIFLSMLIFPPATPMEHTLALAGDLMPILAKLKFLTLAVAVILLVRFALLSRRPEQE